MSVYEKSQQILNEAVKAALPRLYNPDTDYPIILAAAAAAGNVELTQIAKAFEANGIAWPANYNYDHGKLCVQLDMEILRAWKELGYWPKPR